MSLFILLLYFFLIALAMPFILVAAAYYAYVHEGKIGAVIARLVAAFFCYLVIKVPTAAVFDILLYAGAHSDQSRGYAFTLQGTIIILSTATVYSGLCYLCICLAKGAWINPRKLFVGLGLSNKHTSIFGLTER